MKRSDRISILTLALSLLLACSFVLPGSWAVAGVPGIDTNVGDVQTRSLPAVIVTVDDTSQTGVFYSSQIRAVAYDPGLGVPVLLPAGVEAGIGDLIVEGVAPYDRL